jgi:hypothetical protein
MKTVLYACTNLAFDQIFPPVVRTPGVDHVLFTDRRPRRLGAWEWRPLPPETEGLSPTLVNRYAKFFPHRLFPDAEVTIYVDANTLLIGDLGPLIAEFTGSEADIGLFRHGKRADIFEEFAFALEVGRIPPRDVEKGRAQLQRYRDEGLPRDHAFTENAIIFRRHGNPALERAMELWWEELETYTKRDQLSLPYVLHKSGLRAKIWDWNYIDENPYFHRYLHRHSVLHDLNVAMKNKRYYNRVYYHLFGAVLFAYHGVLKSRLPAAARRGVLASVRPRPRQ